MNRLELNWIGKYDKDNQINPEPRLLFENKEYSYRKESVSELEPTLSSCDNMIIHGDNLLALKALENKYASKIKCIYIDPPYNTKSSFEHYDDCLEHSMWLNLMKPRLELLKTLLSNDGSIWISINDDEQAYLKVLCDEIFGRKNYLTTISWQRKYSVSNNYKGIATISEFILVYAKSNAFEINLLPRTSESVARYSNPDNDVRGVWKAVDYLNQATTDKRPNLCYDIVNPNTGEVIKNSVKAWKYDINTHNKHVGENRLWWGINGTNTVPALKLFLSEVRDGMTPHNWWPHAETGHTDEAKKEMIALFGANDVFETPKPERLVERILTIATNKGDLVLDSFLGSGTTAAVAHKMGRNWIGIELGNHAYTHCVPRLKAVIDSEQGGISKSNNWQGGGGYTFLELAPSLLIKDDREHYVISEEYNSVALAVAMAMHKGFAYAPNETVYWKQGVRNQNSFIFTTTNYIYGEYLDKLNSEMNENETLLVCCKAYAKECNKRYKHITVQKIPDILFGRCEFGKDNYDLNIILQDINYALEDIYDGEDI